MNNFSVSRRALLGLVALGSLAGCTATREHPRPQASALTPKPSPAPAMIDCGPAFQALESTFAARLGVWAVDTGSGSTVGYRAAERFAFCSTAKAFLAAMILATTSATRLDAVVHYDRAALIAHSPITTQNLAKGMTVMQLCEAAVRFSDNGAANLLFSELGGPAALEAYLRRSGDAVTMMSRIEPDLSFAVPGDLRDTTTPEAWAANFRNLVLGDLLGADQRTTMTEWLVNNTTGATLVRSAVPPHWKVADKTGSGWYGTRNDIAVIWPPDREPIVMAVMSSKAEQGAAIEDAVVAQASAVVIRAFA